MSDWWRRKKVMIMGVINVTPDSFSDGGKFFNRDQALSQAEKLIAEGADILDIGGESTRPGAMAVSADEEINRVLPVIEALRNCGVPLSVDTRHAATMREAIAAGAGMINDVTALRGDKNSKAVIAENTVPVCLMHMKGEPRTMQDNPHYDDVVAEVKEFFATNIAACAAAGIARERIIIDPGIGFGKKLEHNLALLRALHEFTAGDIPLLIGVSRKRFIDELCDVPDPAARLPGTIAACLQAVTQGARILRVHDVAAMRQALTIHEALRPQDGLT